MKRWLVPGCILRRKSSLCFHFLFCFFISCICRPHAVRCLGSSGSLHKRRRAATLHVMFWMNSNHSLSSLTCFKSGTDTALGIAAGGYGQANVGEKEGAERFCSAICGGRRDGRLGGEAHSRRGWNIVVIAGDMQVICQSLFGDWKADVKGVVRRGSCRKNKS